MQMSDKAANVIRRWSVWPFGGSMEQHKQKVAKRLLVKRIQIQLRKAPKDSQFVDTSSKGSNNDDRKQELIRKFKPTWSEKEKAAKFPYVDENILRDMSICRKNIQQTPPENDVDNPSKRKVLFRNKRTYLIHSTETLKNTLQVGYGEWWVSKKARKYHMLQRIIGAISKKEKKNVLNVGCMEWTSKCKATLKLCWRRRLQGKSMHSQPNLFSYLLVHIFHQPHQPYANDPSNKNN